VGLDERQVVEKAKQSGLLLDLCFAQLAPCLGQPPVPGSQPGLPPLAGPARPHGLHSPLHLAAPPPLARRDR